MASSFVYAASPRLMPSVDLPARGRPEAAAIFLSPRDPGEDAARLRRSGVARGLVAWVVGTVLWIVGRPGVGAVALSLGTLTLLLALGSPTRGYAALSHLVDRVGQLVGRALAWLLLTPVYLVLFVPFRLLFRRGDGDTLARGFDRTRASYWSAHGPARDLEKPY